ncbi:hypothetical protein [Polycladidibacter hongkongensis]|uniref:hypothetical protein n=1 Tax=Polycladidibacter hongkongensis TaxID=1647556 RepID=UPI00083519A2|nr:hypothetical protein [Pseudovibrio hongkongensis]
MSRPSFVATSAPEQIKGSVPIRPVPQIYNGRLAMMGSFGIGRIPSLTRLFKWFRGWFFV